MHDRMYGLYACVLECMHDLGLYVYIVQVCMDTACLHMECICMSAARLPPHVNIEIEKESILHLMLGLIIMHIRSMVSLLK